MWINVESTEEKDSKAEIWVTKNLFEKTGDNAWISFGLKKMHVKVRQLLEENSILGMDFDRPVTLKMSQKVLNSLFIKTDNVYQIKVDRESIVIGPVIGLLLGEQHYYYHDRIMARYTDAMSGYKNLGGLVCAFKSCSIDWEHDCVYGLYFNHGEQKWKFGMFPLPSVIYKKAFDIPLETIEKLKKATGNKVFNSRRFNKWQMYEEIKKDPLLEKYLPDTVKLTSVQLLRDFLGNHKKIILKPVGLSLGKGICILQKNNAGNIQVIDYHDGTRFSQQTLSEQEALDYVRTSNFTKKTIFYNPI
jgi:hypothetical protein